MTAMLYYFFNIFRSSIFSTWFIKKYDNTIKQTALVWYISLKFSPTEYCVAENVGSSLIFNNLPFTVNGQFFFSFCLKLVIRVVSKLS